ncbi:ATP-binding cassette domain-containing protein [Thalassospira australica]|uniref:ATP-binding cassette domain-containing protein n=1 Tax=Thalassospira australica TaxID=1528106 RepID=UPI00138E2B25|nr:ATP-binding cassette domain-containing protein [Thalassospira australica]
MATQMMPPGLTPSVDSLGNLLNTVRYDGVRKLFYLAGASISPVDMSNLREASGKFQFEEISEISLTLSIAPQIKRDRLENLLLHENLFAFETAGEELHIFIPGADGEIQCLSPETGLEQAMPDLATRGRAIILQESNDPGRADPKVSQTKFNWLKTALSGSKNSVFQLAIITFVASILALAMPMFTLAVYSQVLPTQSVDALLYLSVGLVVATCAEFSLRMLRSRILSNAAALLDLKVSVSRNSRLMRMSVALARRFNSRDASAIIKDHERLSNIVTGPIGTAILELPIFVVYLAVLALLGGWLALIPVILLAVGCILILRLLSYANERTKSALRRAEEYGVICDELSRRLFVMKREGSGAVWHRRFTNASARLAEAEMQRQKTFSYARIATNALTSLIVTISLAFGAVMAMNEVIGPGELIAVVAVVWRMMAPVPSVLEAVLRREEITNLIDNATYTANDSPEEARSHALGGQGAGIDGRVSFSSVLFNYKSGQAPALRNLSFEVKPRELVVITGTSGAGKSTVLDLIAGLHSPQLGTVTIDGVFPAQVPQSVLLQSVGYLSRDSNILPVTIREFLAMGREKFSKVEIVEASKQQAIDEDISQLPDGYETRICDMAQDSSLLRRIGLARVLMTQSSLILIDEPDASSAEVRAAFLSTIRQIRDDTTIIIVTHEPDYISVADRILVMNQGTIVRDCTPKDIVRQREAIKA